MLKYEIRFVCVGLFAYIFFPLILLFPLPNLSGCVCDRMTFFFFLFPIDLEKPTKTSR